MGARIAFLTIAISWLVPGEASSETMDPGELGRFASDTRVELVRSLLGANLPGKELAKVKITHDKSADVNLSNTGHLGGLFSRSNENFVFSGSKLFLLNKESDRQAGAERYFFEPVEEIIAEEGATLFEKIEWENIFFIVVCYRQPWCRILMSRSGDSITFQQNIATETVPTDAEFFIDNRQLFLIVAAQISTIYRWTGAYFDENDRLDTYGASAVTWFPDGDVVVLVVARKTSTRKVRSMAYLRRNGKTELVQVLETNEALDAVSYTLDGGELFRFVFFLEETESSTLFWWNGREFTLWRSIRDVVGPGRISVHSLLSETFIFLTSSNELRLYHPTPTSFDLLHKIVMEREILDLNVCGEASHPATVLFLTGSRFDSFLTVSVIAIDVNYVPVSDSRKADTDPVLRCLRDLESTFDDRNSKLDESISLSNEMQKKKGAIALENLKVSEAELRNFVVNRLKVNPSGERLEATPTEIRKRLQELVADSKDLLRTVESLTKNVRYRIHGDVVVSRAKATKIRAKKFNGRSFDLSNILSVTEDQTLVGAVRLKTLSADKLDVPCVNGVYVRDILVRNSTVQEIMGKHTLLSLRAKHMVFGKLGKVNGTPFSAATGLQEASFSVAAVFAKRNAISRLSVKQFHAETINNVSAEEWVSKVLPDSRAFGPNDTLDFDDASIVNLTVSVVNGLPWKTYLESLLPSASKDGSDATSIRADTIKAKRLRAESLNGEATETFQTKKFDRKVHVRSIPRKVATEPLLSSKKIRFTHPLNVSGRIVDFNNLETVYWMKSQPQVVRATPVFRKEIAIRDLEAAQICGSETKQFVWLDQPSTVRGQVLMENSVRVVGNLTLSSGSEASILRELQRGAARVSGQNRFTASKTFSTTLHADRLAVFFANERPLQLAPPFPKRLRRVETQTGNVHVKGGIKLNNLNGRRFSRVIAEALRLDGVDVLERGNFSSLAVKHINVEKINGLNVGNRFRSFERKRNVRLIVDGDLVVPSVQAKTVNGFPFNEYVTKVVRRNGKLSLLKGGKTFRRTASIKGNLDGVLNGCDVAQLERTGLSKSKPQIVTGSYETDTLDADDVDVDFIGDVPTSLLLFFDDPDIRIVGSDLVFSDFAVAGALNARDSFPGCNLSRSLDVSDEKIEKVGWLDARGDAGWKKNLTHHKGLSYFYENAVVERVPQFVPASVRFRSSVNFQKLNTKMDFDRVPLQFIVDDALYRSVPVQEVSQNVAFKGVVDAENILVVNNAIIDTIDGLDVPDFDERLVRNTANTRVTGKKHFTRGLAAFYFHADTINESGTEAIVFCDAANEVIHIPPTSFHSVKATRDLKVVNADGANVDDLVRGRLSKSKDDSVSGLLLLADGGLRIRGDAEVPRINDVDTADTASASGETLPRLILGETTFDTGLALPYAARVGTINGRDPSETHARALLQHSNVTIVRGSIVFTEGAVNMGSLDVSGDVNACDAATLKAQFTPRSIAQSGEAFAAKLRAEVRGFGNVIDRHVKGTVFSDALLKTSLPLQLSTLQETIANHVDGGTVVLNVYGLSEDGPSCGLAAGCLCPRHAVAHVSSLDPNGTSFRVGASRSYDYYDENLKVEVTVVSNAVSYSSRCLRQKKSTVEELTKLSWRGNETAHESLILAGYLSHVKFFTVGHSIFIVMAYYSPDTSGLNLDVYELKVKQNAAAVEKVQTILAEGAQALDLFWTSQGVVLVVGNGRDTETFPELSHSAVYRFDEFRNKFQLLRIVNTHAVLSIASVSYKQTSFIFLVQKESWPLLIFKYNREYDNYYFIQKLDIARSGLRSNFLSATAFATTRGEGYDGDILMGVVQSDGSFRIYKYKHVEGFVQIMRQDQRNVAMLTSFWLGHRQYLFAASSNENSYIYELTRQGYVE